MCLAGLGKVPGVKRLSLCQRKGCLAAGRDSERRSFPSRWFLPSSLPPRYLGSDLTRLCSAVGKITEGRQLQEGLECCAKCGLFLFQVKIH